MAKPPLRAARRGLMFVLSSPSGAGKTTLSRKVLETDRDITLSVSVTTRPRRGSEVDGVDYHFMTARQFDRMREHGELLEWAEVHGNLYGTPKEKVEDDLARGCDVLFDIDWQGTRQLAEAMPDDVVRLFILPPSMKELRLRLERRAEDQRDVIDRRVRAARDEIEHWDEYDYVFANHDVQDSLVIVRAILVAERRKRCRNPALEGFVADLLSET